MNRDHPPGALDRLLAAWCAEIDSVPIPDLVTTEQALDILARSPACGRLPHAGRNRRGPGRARRRRNPVTYLTRHRCTRG
ncbi:hypothetical protein [Amycolatopsis magusensis]|uniref:Uncharacterized protein n=1 Tax=Amycolatopsis magusensis TaxID=882444 RepID=A0ABS4PQL6_9PSEU|nr:hypothetical protein [Amycolatopsis magusensis]MBP2181699.1 hypothetical protein [Amycolatopsis magusensis]